MRLTLSMLQADVSRLGWTLMHSLWEGAGVAALLAISLFLLRRHGSQSRYVMSCAAMALLLLLPVATFLMLAPPAPVTSSALSVAPPVVLPDGANASVNTSRGHGRDIADHPNRIAAEIHDAVPTASIPAALAPSTPTAARLDVQQLLRWLVFAWATGVGVFSIRNLAGWIALQRLKSTGASSVTPQLQQQLHALTARLGLRKPVRLLESVRVRSPLVIGAFKPIILFPASVLCELPLAQLESILAHELAHIRRHDYLVNLIQSVIETLMFYHPATWWISRVIRIERENCCDDIALNVCPDRATYVSALAQLAAVRTPPLALAAHGGLLLARVRRVLGTPKKETRSNSGWAVGALGLIAACIVAALVTAAPRSRAQEARPTTQPASTQVATTQPATPRSIHVRFVDGAGKPVTGVNGTYWLNEKQHSFKRYESDKDGELIVELPPEAHSLTFFHSKGGFVNGQMQIGRGYTADDLPESYTLVLNQGKTISGTVVDQQNNPVENVQIQVTFFYNDAEQPDGISTWRASASTNADGRWTVDGAPSTVIRAEISTRHPDFTLASIQHTVPSSQYASLLAGKQVSVAQRGIDVTGFVNDAAAKPIANARIGPDHSDRIKEASSEAGGYFELHGVTPGSQQFVLYARGYAPQVVKIDAQSGMAPLKFQLWPGRELHGSARWADGKPAVGVNLSIDWRGRQLGVLIVTDAEGRFVWKDAPADEVMISASDMRMFTTVSVAATAGKEDVLLKLPRIFSAVALHGNVVDDVTGKPIDQFSVHVTAFVEGKVQWSMDRRGIKGVYDLAAPQGGEQFELRVTSMEYLASESKRLTPDGNVVNFNALLTKVGSVPGSVLTPNGTPAVGADVILMEHMGVRVVDGKADDWSRGASVSARTNAAGNFIFPKRDAPIRVMALHDSGWAVLQNVGETSLQGIKLRPWSTVEGVATRDGRPAAGQKISMWPASVRGNLQELYGFRLSAVCDDQGRFKLIGVPEGMFDIGIEMKLPMFDQRISLVQTSVRRLKIAAGEHKQDVQIGGRGATIVGKILPSEVLKAEGRTPQGGELYRLQPHLVQPFGWENYTEEQKNGVRDAFEAGQQMTEFKAHVQRYAFAIESDGTFRLTDVEPGNYQLSINMQTADRDNRMLPKWMGLAYKQIVVPPAAAQQSGALPIDIGTLQMYDVGKLKIGDAAPELEAPALADGKPIKLSDLRGKYVLVQFWTAWVGSSYSEAPILKDLQAKYARDGRLAIFSISKDESVERPQRFVAERQITWPQGYLGIDSGSGTAIRWNAGFEDLFLVDPEGKIVKVGISAKDLRATVEEALGAPRK